MDDIVVTCLLPIALKEIDEAICRTIVRQDFFAGIKFRFNGLGQLLAQLDAPLIERVNVPDDTLHKDLMLVHCCKKEQMKRKNDYGIHNNEQF